MKRIHLVAIVVGAVVVLAAVVMFSVGGRDVLTESPLRRALPGSATDVHDLYVDMDQDYSYYLAARLPREDFEAYCAGQNLTPHTPERIYTDGTEWLDWGAMTLNPSEPMDWWLPTESLAGTYVNQQGHHWTMAKWQDGVIYVKAISH